MSARLRAGIQTWIIPDVVVRHDVSRTTGELPSATIRYAYRNHFRLAFRHAGWARVVVAGELVWTLAKISVRQVAFPAFRHDEWYHARPGPVRGFLFGRFGPDPVVS